MRRLERQYRKKNFQFSANRLLRIILCQQVRYPCYNFVYSGFFCFSLFFLNMQLTKNNRSRLWNILKNHKKNKNLVMYNSCENMAFIQDRKCKLRMAAYCLENLNHFRAICMENPLKKSINLYTKKWVNNQQYFYVLSSLTLLLFTVSHNICVFYMDIHILIANTWQFMSIAVNSIHLLPCWF